MPWSSRFHPVENTASKNEKWEARIDPQLNNIWSLLDFGRDTFQFSQERSEGRITRRKGMAPPCLLWASSVASHWQRSIYDWRTQALRNRICVALRPPSESSTGWLSQKVVQLGRVNSSFSSFPSLGSCFPSKFYLPIPQQAGQPLVFSAGIDVGLS